ncbi:hypothetical protein OIU79_030319 [Salix purpurea]|uniref:Uncharacterized protein n=1 Tax=Salix purpurea TaxID=77065 RepID=A0A9Q0ZRM0_SALPP|nr:hypothetical protein OIU79_030319 [Salix purpurea]
MRGLGLGTGKGVTNTCHVRGVASWIHSGFCSLGCKIVGTSKSFEGRREGARRWMVETREESMNGRHGCIRFFEQVSLFNASFMPMLVEANAICNAWIA